MNEPERFREALQAYSASRGKSTAILGKGRLWEIWADMDRTVVPEWMGSAPHHIGDGQHRKVGADDWRLFATVNLVITMPRLWGHLSPDSRERHLLVNLMHMVTATKYACYRRMNVRFIDAYIKHTLAWLQGLVVLFPGISLASNQHLAVHLPFFLLHFGPTHAWRCFAYERWNYVLQRINTNNHIGKSANLLP